MSSKALAFRVREANARADREQALGHRRGYGGLDVGLQRIALTERGSASEVDLDALNRAKTFSEYFELKFENIMKNRLLALVKKL